MRKAEKNGQAMPTILQKGICPLPTDEDGKTHLPTVSELLYPIYTEGKLVREGGSLTIRCIGSDFMVTINCPTERVQITMVIHTLIDLLVEVEGSLSAGRYTLDKAYSEKKRARHRIDRALQ